MLAEGKFVYQGPVNAAVRHFGAIGYQCPEFSNPADYFIQITHSSEKDKKDFTKMYKAYDATIAPQIAREVGKKNKKKLFDNFSK